MKIKELEQTFIGRDCIVCKQHYTSKVYTNDLERYNNGELIQNCFPYLTTDEREIFISGICGECFDIMMAPDN